MQVEDTKHKVYIYDLDKELAESESDEERPIFIPDIEKHLNKIPKHILIGDDARALANMQMVLYNVPSSLTVPQEKDSVRRAIIESRQRQRESQAMGYELAVDEHSEGARSKRVHSNFTTDTMEEQDLDAMDLD
jgi:hypothetical protein